MSIKIDRPFVKIINRADGSCSYYVDCKTWKAKLVRSAAFSTEEIATEKMREFKRIFYSEAKKIETGKIKSYHIVGGLVADNLFYYVKKSSKAFTTSRKSF